MQFSPTLRFLAATSDFCELSRSDDALLMVLRGYAMILSEIRADSILSQKLGACLLFLECEEMYCYSASFAVPLGLSTVDALMLSMTGALLLVGSSFGTFCQS